MEKVYGSRIIDAEKQEIMGAIQNELSADFFPIDPRLSEWISVVLSYLPEEERDYFIYDLRIGIIQVYFNTVFKFAAIENKDRIFICFTSDLCNLPPSEIIYIIAHEFAHALLNHYIFATLEMEIQADQQVIDWGFEKELDDSGCSYIRREIRK